jgi:hypothetical protein
MKVKDVMHKGVDWVSPDTPPAEEAWRVRLIARRAVVSSRERIPQCYGNPANQTHRTRQDADLKAAESASLRRPSQAVHNHRTPAVGGSETSSLREPSIRVASTN